MCRTSSGRWEISWLLMSRRVELKKQWKTYYLEETTSPQRTLKCLEETSVSPAIKPLAQTTTGQVQVKNEASRERRDSSLINLTLKKLFILTWLLVRGQFIIWRADHWYIRLHCLRIYGCLDTWDRACKWIELYAFDHGFDFLEVAKLLGDEFIGRYALRQIHIFLAIYSGNHVNWIKS